MSFSGGPRKSRRQQWHMGRRHGARFTCGLCHHHFSRRDNLNRHKGKCYSDEARFNGILTDCKINVNRDPRKPPKPLVATKKGRPKLAEYACEVCGRKLQSACKKRDHQRRCKPTLLIINPIRDINPNPNLLELLKCSKILFRKDKHGYDVARLWYSQDPPRLTQ